jgi:hypothetical protein
MSWKDLLFGDVEPPSGIGECFMCGEPIDLARALYFQKADRSTPASPVHPGCCRTDPVGIFAMASEHQRHIVDSIGLGRDMPQPYSGIYERARDVIRRYVQPWKRSAR